MRIDSFIQQGNVSAVQQEKTMSLPQKGDVLRADVISQQDDGVMLRMEDGRVIRARLETDVMLLPSDSAELLVLESTADKLLLRLVYVQPSAQEANSMPQGKPASANGNLPPDIAQLMQAFESMDSKPSAQTINHAAQAMQEYGIDAKTAAFLCANSIEISERTIRTLQDMVSGKSLGKTLFELANGIQLTAGQENENTAGLTCTASSENFKPTAVTSGMNAVQEPAVLQQEISAAQIVKDRQQAELITKAGKAPAGTEKDVPVQNKPEDMEYIGTRQSNTVGLQSEQPEISGAQNARTQAGSASNQAGTNLTIPQGTERSSEPEKAANPIIQYEAADRNVQYPAEVSISGNSASFSKNAVEPLSSRELSDKILSLFIKTDEALNAESLKNTAKDAVSKLPQLQEWIKHTDINDKQAALTRLDDAQAQAKLAQDISRFVCMQIPVAMKGYETAELYVYRRNRKDGKIDPENTAIALGISTQTLGRVEALLRVENRTISIAFGVENEAAVPAFREETASLKRALSGLRYSLAECKVSKLTAKTTPVNAEEALSAAAKRKRGVTIEYMV